MRKELGRQILALEVVRRGSPDFIGLWDVSSGALYGSPLIAILYSVDHRLGDLRKSAREVRAARLFCFTAGFSGSPGVSYLRQAGAAQFL